jgi:hypothetical protein
MLTASALLPPSHKWRRYEQTALKIRNFAGVALDERLDPFELAGCAGLQVISLDQVKGLSEETRKQLLSVDPGSWSGGASKSLPDGSRLIILNPQHARTRQCATLMEEVCHVFLGHQPSRIQASASNVQRVESLHGRRHAFRDYNDTDEEEAYAVGAAALVPYYGLRRALEEGITVATIARRYGVSMKLVEYRLKVSHLWAEYQQHTGSRQSQ